MENITPRSNQCPVYQLFEVFGKKRTLHIFHALAEEIDSFSGIMRRIPQINSKVLTERLDLLVEKKLVSRVVSQSKPLKINYYLSTQGEDLHKQIKHLANWALKE